MHRIISCLIFPLALAGCLESLNPANLQPAELTKPPFMVDDPYALHTDGSTNDLVSAGLGLAGLRAPMPALTPDSTESLRRHAIHQNFNALLAMKEQDGYGTLYATHMATGGPVAGTEYRLPVRYSDHAIAAILMLQVPASFNAQSPCIVATASSGSRGIYGAAGVVGAWALHQGCAVVTTDKGTGTGFHLLGENMASHWLGAALPANTEHHRELHYAEDIAALSPFNEKNPHRIATRHAHSGRVPEKDWGRFVLQAIQFGFYQLNQHHRPSEQPDFSFLRNNTTVLAAAISNGGAAVLAAAEQDDGGWIDGVVVSEPNVFLPGGTQYLHGNQTQNVNSLLTTAARTALLAPCAALAEDLPSPLAAYQLPLFQAHFKQRCADLKKDGLITGDSVADQAQDALARLQADGLNERALPLLTTSSAIHLWEAILVNYTNNFTRARVENALCGLSYAYTDSTGNPTAMPPEKHERLFGNSGIPPVDGISIVNNRNQKALAFSVNNALQPDLAYDSIRCLSEQIQSATLRQTEADIALTGALKGLPTLVVQGGADNLIQPAHHARAYAVLNQRQEPNKSQLRYIEVKQGQHFDAFLNLPPLRPYFVPLHPYFEQAMDAMLAHLRDQAPLPPSQLIDAPPAKDPVAPLVSLPSIAFNAETIAASPQHQALLITGGGITEK
ncbi:putative D--3-hydroxybutyrate oligomer hydrolase lipoprotein transmembrane [Simiduia agarivorans]|uniref:D--3-hydroxybutyrate oligomer hydrolase lipoprotein transmembrane n=1 Tax=Simiduia agarivorans (strain DSM 21679 / JCM 13881 / BCRC 17597 / SA1) TaxID=1117647 RepID=K4KG99_SIMAS|nr:putative D--3-hydroxybutyrate oligomer hydrolase lipoprotein transmembrane [Simiduia agarivorans]AFU98001.1 putative D--3-hydroxybutyrate oligomer hydrolase lipoprotein transmembrane [Simiduia agarivorans SA1 = DSM 21679]